MRMLIAEDDKELLKSLKFIDEGVENIGYAIPSNLAVAVANNIIDNCFETDVERIQRAILGVTVYATDSKAVYDSETSRVHIEESVAVYEIASNSLADGSLAVGDVIVSIAVNGGAEMEVSRQYHILDFMIDVRLSDEISIAIIRGGEKMVVTVTVTEDCFYPY